MKLIPKQVLEKIEKWATIFYLSASVFISFLLVETVILTLVHQFKPLFLYFSLISAFVVAVLFSIPLKRDVKFLPKITVPIIFLILLISLILIFFPHDTFGGRDEAVYLNYAVHLAKNGSLNFSSYLNHLPDNFVENVKIAPPAYTIYLATQQVFFGIQGLLRGNLIIIILGLFSFFLVSSYIGGSKIGLIATVLFSSSMPFLWFSRETMSENLSFFLLWSLILFLFIFLKTKRFIYLSITFLCSWLFALTRIEGFFIQLLLFFIIPIILYFYKVISLKKIFIVMFIYFLLVISNIVIVKNLYFPFLKTMVSAVKYTTNNNLKFILPEKKLSTFTQSTELNKVESDKLGKKFILFFSLMLVKYNLLIIVLSIFLVIPLFLLQFYKIKNSAIYFFIILAIILPELLKIISLNVTLDQPFMYRRYLYALLPLGYLCFSFFLNQLKNKKLIIIIVGTFFIINIIFSKNIIFLKNNWSLINKIGKITTNISQNDFVIVESRPLKDYSSYSYMRLQKGIRSVPEYTVTSSNFFPEKKTFNGVPYKKIFLLSVTKKDNYSFFKTVLKTSEDVEYVQLVRSCELNLLGEEERLINSFNINILSFSNAVRYCDKPGNEILYHKETLYLYELVYDKI